MSDNKDGNVKDVVEILEEDDEFEVYQIYSSILLIMMIGIWECKLGWCTREWWRAIMAGRVSKFPTYQPHIISQDDWDDVDTNDDFTDQLRQHIESKSSS